MGSWLFQETRRHWSETRGPISFARMEELARESAVCACLINPNDASFVTPGDMPERIVRFCTASGRGNPPATARSYGPSTILSPSISAASSNSSKLCSASGTSF